jgi:hypothetical protein
LDYVAQFYDPKGFGVSGSYESAVQARLVFKELYHYAAPFNSRSL